MPKVEMTREQMEAVRRAIGFALAGEIGEPPIETMNEVKKLERALAALEKQSAHPQTKEDR